MTSGSLAWQRTRRMAYSYSVLMICVDFINVVFIRVAFVCVASICVTMICFGKIGERGRNDTLSERQVDPGE